MRIVMVRKGGRWYWHARSKGQTTLQGPPHGNAHRVTACDTLENSLGGQVLYDPQPGRGRVPVALVRPLFSLDEDERIPIEVHRQPSTPPRR